MNKIIIGYFEKESFPEGISDNNAIIKTLKIIFKDPLVETLYYKGLSPCRCCGNFNGCAEYIIKFEDTEFIIPEGYIHYLKTHKLDPDPNLKLLFKIYGNYIENKAETIYNKLKSPITKENMELAYSLGLIKKSNLKHEQWYYGSCRNSSTAKWNSQKNIFEYVRTKFGQSYWDQIEHPEDDTGYDIFIPIIEIDDDESVNPLL